jgi:hypothetical protein
MASVVKACKQPGLGSWLGLPTSPAEMQASLSPADYVYGQPTQQQLQRLLKQQMAGVSPAGNHSSAPATGFGTAGALQGEHGSWASSCSLGCLQPSQPRRRALSITNTSHEGKENGPRP